MTVLVIFTRQGKAGRTPGASERGGLERTDRTSGLGRQIPLSPEKQANYWRDVREAEGVRLESVCTARYRGFESPSLRIPSVVRLCAIAYHPTPSGPEGSSGK